MKRLSWLTGVCTTAVGVAVLMTPNAAAQDAGHRPPAGLGPDGPVPAVASGPAVATAADDVPDIEWPPPGVVPPKHSAEKLREFAAAMQKHLDTAFPAVVPNAKDLSWVEWGGEWAGVIEDGQDYLTTWSVYSDELGSTGQAFQIEAPGNFTNSPKDQCAQEGTISCDATILDDGSLVLDWRSAYETDTRTNHINAVMHYRTDGSVVWISSYDYDPIFDDSQGPPRDEVALTTEQLTALATDPELHL
jgi:hypothetical protein